ncbi:MAG: 16S rRNA (cytidine(1402)-2'-O)-methyltransferase [Desulfobulbaceae bacterium]|nr:16S rRNA (cytidine(1402)-2'-O)-methyltransferase [Desulfobulbaceae bacterium]
MTEIRKAGTLYVVATPIGNLEDITIRAVRILKEVALVASEDTRHTRKLLSHLGISTTLLSYYKGKEASRAEPILQRLQEGDDVALVSDAGTPGISDPGALLVKKARESNITVVPVPGPSALTAAMSVAGFEDTAFHFVGFLPSRGGERRKFLKTLVSEKPLIIFYESPQRIVAALEDCFAVFGDRRISVAREITKMYEEFFIGSLAEAIADFKHRDKIKGEFVVIVAGGEEEEQPTADDLDALLVWYRDNSELSLKDASRRVAKDMGLSRSQVYRRALDLWQS